MPEDRRKYRPGPVVESLDQAVKQEFLYMDSQIYHKGWFMSWPVRSFDGYIRAGRLRYAIRRKEKSQEKEAL